MWVLPVGADIPVPFARKEKRKNRDSCRMGVGAVPNTFSAYSIGMEGNTCGHHPEPSLVSLSGTRFRYFTLKLRQAYICITKALLFKPGTHSVLNYFVCAHGFISIFYFFLVYIAQPFRFSKEPYLQFLHLYCPLLY